MLCPFESNRGPPDRYFPRLCAMRRMLPLHTRRIPRTPCAGITTGTPQEDHEQYEQQLLFSGKFDAGFRIEQWHRQSARQATGGHEERVGLEERIGRGCKGRGRAEDPTFGPGERYR